MKSMFIILFLSLLLITACSPNAGLTYNGDCPKNYIPLRSVCCIDSNANNVCDRDDEFLEDLEEKELEKVARDFGRFMEKKDPAKIYDVLTAKKKSLISKEEFIKRFYRVVSKHHQLYLTSKLRSMIFIEAKIKENDGYVTYGIGVLKGFEKYTAVHYFKKEVDGWKYDGFDDVFYGYCVVPEDCSTPTLLEECSFTCMKTIYPYEREEPFVCEAHVCQCPCSMKEDKLYTTPMWNSLH